MIRLAFAVAALVALAIGAVLYPEHVDCGPDGGIVSVMNCR